MAATNEAPRLRINPGYAFSETVQWLSNGTAVNLTGYSVRAWGAIVTDDETAPTITDAAQLELTCTVVTPQATAANTGKVTVSLTAEQTDALDDGTTYYCDLIASSGGVDTVLDGFYLVVEKSVTRPV